MGALSVGMWWLFDRSRGGLGLSVAFTLLSTALTHLLLDPSSLTYVQFYIIDSFDQEPQISLNSV